MTSPIPSDYYTPPTGDGGEGSAYTGPSDLGNMVPSVSMRWTSSPTYNAEPGDAPQGGEGESHEVTAPTAAFSADLGGMHDAENQMITATSTGVTAYEQLKANVLAAINGDVIFGQQDTDEVWRQEQGGIIGGTPNMVRDDVDSPIQEGARQFAATMRPIQQMALLQIGNVLELAGQYIGAVNTAGRTYATIDRASQFPDPPATGG